MPRPKKQAAVPQETVPATAPGRMSYMGKQAIVTNTHPDGCLDLAVDYDGKIVQKFRVSPEAVGYENAP